MNRTRRSIVELDLRPVIGRVGIDSWRPCSPTVVGHRRGIGDVGWRRRGPGARAIGRRRRRSSPADSEMGTIWQMVRSGGPTPADGNEGLPDHPTRQRGAAARAGMVENRSYEMSVGMLSPRQQRKYVERTRDGTMQWKSCHKGHPMFRVSAPPKPQTPGPTRPALPAPHEGRPG